MQKHATTHRHIAEDAIIEAWYAELFHQMSLVEKREQTKWAFFEKVMPICRVASTTMQGVRNMD